MYLIYYLTNDSLENLQSVNNDGYFSILFALVVHNLSLQGHI